MQGLTGWQAREPRYPSYHPICLILWDPEDRVVEFHKTEYSRLQAEKDMVRAGLPVEAASRSLTDEEIALLER